MCVQYVHHLRKKPNINYLGVDFVKKSQELKCKGCKKVIKHNQWNFNNYCSDCVKDWKTDTIQCSCPSCRGERTIRILITICLILFIIFLIKAFIFG